MFSTRIETNPEGNPLVRLLEAQKHKGTPIIDLTESNPSKTGLRPREEMVKYALSDPHILEYEPHPKGIPEARQAVCDYYRSLGVARDPEAIFLTASTSEAYSMLFKLLANPYDEFLVPAPSYPLFESLAVFDSVKVVPYHLVYSSALGWRIDFETLMAGISSKTRGVIAVHPNNPTGSYLSPQEVWQLDNLCHSYDMALIVDEVFLNYPRSSILSPATSVVGCQTLTFTLSGLSKPLCLPQVKLGWMCLSGPPSLVQQASEKLEYLLDAYLGVNAMVQKGAALLLKEGPDIQSRVLQRIEQNENFLMEKLNGLNKVKILRREGGWYAVLHLGNDVSDEEFALELLEKFHVLVHPGYYYDFYEDGHLVISLIVRHDAFCLGVERLTSQIERI